MKYLRRILVAQPGASLGRRIARSLAVLGISSIAVLTVGSVFALLTDTVSFTGGTASSNDWDGGPPPDPNAALDLRVKAGDCIPGEDGTDMAVFVDDPTISLASNGVELDFAHLAALPAGQTDRVAAHMATFCVFNASAYTGEVFTTLLSASSTEMSDCGLSEADAETQLGYSGCLIGEQGELDQFTEIRIEFFNGDAADCSGSQSGGAWHEVSNTIGLANRVGQIDPDATCQMQVYVYSEYATSGSLGPDPAVLAALSDTLSFDLALDLSEL